MADLKPVERLTRDLLRVERQYFKDAGDLLEGVRRELFEATVGLGIENIGLVPAITRTLEIARGGLMRIGTEHRPTIETAALLSARDQLDAVRIIDPDIPSIEELRNGRIEEASFADLQGGLTGWEYAARGSLISEVYRLRRENVGDDVAAKMLFDKGKPLGRASTWRKGLSGFDIAAQLAIWGAGNALVRGWFRQGEQITGRSWERQAIAAIDERTTDCCLQVHGQIRALDKPFKLTGTPRFADEMMGPPFHWFCRTATVLYVKELEIVGKSTKEMRAAANSELKARAKTGKRVEIHPAHATSKRRR